MTARRRALRGAVAGSGAPAPFYLYSTDSAEGRDHGSWQSAATQPNIDAEMWMIWMAQQNRMNEAASVNPPSDADALAVRALTSNVHWRAPTA